MLSDNSLQHLFNMVKFLKSHNKIDAALQIELLYEDLSYFKLLIKKRHKRLEGVMYATEWWCSGDYGENQFDKEWNKFMEKIE